MRASTPECDLSCAILRPLSVSIDGPARFSLLRGDSERRIALQRFSFDRGGCHKIQPDPQGSPFEPVGGVPPLTQHCGRIFEPTSFCIEALHQRGAQIRKLDWRLTWCERKRLPPKWRPSEGISIRTDQPRSLHQNRSQQAPRGARVITTWRQMSYSAA